MGDQQDDEERALSLQNGSDVIPTIKSETCGVDRVNTATTI